MVKKKTREQIFMDMTDELSKAGGYVCFYVDMHGDLKCSFDVQDLNGAEFNGLFNHVSSWVDDNTADEDEDEDEDEEEGDGDVLLKNNLEA